MVIQFSSNGNVCLFDLFLSSNITHKLIFPSQISRLKSVENMLLITNMFQLAKI